MKTPIDGGPAFPVLSDNVSFPTLFGMNLRDYFAAKAMAALIACAPNHGDVAHDFASVDAYRYADAMIKARSES